MTNKQALRKAHKRWGEKAHLEITKQPNAVGHTCDVGRIELGMFFSVEGTGKTWEEAFDNAAARRRRERQSFAEQWVKTHGVPPPASKLVPESADPLLA